jgi:hypothetical protein
MGLELSSFIFLLISFCAIIGDETERHAQWLQQGKLEIITKILSFVF